VICWGGGAGFGYEYSYLITRAAAIAAASSELLSSVVTNPSRHKPQASQTPGVTNPRRHKSQDRRAARWRGRLNNRRYVGPPMPGPFAILSPRSRESEAIASFNNRDRYFSAWRWFGRLRRCKGLCMRLAKHLSRRPRASRFLEETLRRSRRAARSCFLSRGIPGRRQERFARMRKAPIR
jgi:hypothetical protein